MLVANQISGAQSFNKLQEANEWSVQLPVHCNQGRVGVLLVTKGLIKHELRGGDFWLTRGLVWRNRGHLDYRRFNQESAEVC